MTDPDRLDLRDIGEADVYIGDELAAHLVRQRGDSVSFEYVGEAHPTDRRVRDRSVSWSLLRSGEYPVTTTGGAVPSYFAGLLAEGVRLGVVTSSTKTSAGDHLTLLLAIGADTVGNVRVFPAGVDPVQPLRLFQPESDTDFRAVFAKLTGSVRADPVGLAGAGPRQSAGSGTTRTPSIRNGLAHHQCLVAFHHLGSGSLTRADRSVDEP
ncbi:MAG: serine/threonine-protein kinase HipA, partial [Mycobacterium sp.]|nr:serine/threonine-protein kinase HipA [Mycobacterium sp.]